MCVCGKFNEMDGEVMDPLLDELCICRDVGPQCSEVMELVSRLSHNVLLHQCLHNGRYISLLPGCGVYFPVYTL